MFFPCNILMCCFFRKFFCILYYINLKLAKNFNIFFYSILLAVQTIKILGLEFKKNGCIFVGIPSFAKNEKTIFPSFDRGKTKKNVNKK